MSPTLIVRERSFSKFNRETHIIQKVEGLTDVLLWSALKKTFYEISPSEVKKQVTGDGRAEKQLVAESLPKYIGEQKYNNDDESDACAVAIAFLLRENYLDRPDGKEET